MAKITTTEVAESLPDLSPHHRGSFEKPARERHEADVQRAGAGGAVRKRAVPENVSEEAAPRREKEASPSPVKKDADKKSVVQAGYKVPPGGAIGIGERRFFPGDTMPVEILDQLPEMVQRRVKGEA